MRDQITGPTAPPTSDALARLMKATPGEAMTFDWVVAELGERSFGLIMLVLALLTFVPGISYVASVLVIWVAVQMILNRPCPTLPRFISGRAVRRERFTKIVDRAVRVLRWLERFIRPRWNRLFTTGKRGLGGILLLLGLSLTIPMPLSNYLPAVAIMALALAFLEQDGLLLILALVASLVSYAVSIGTVWGTIYGVDALTAL